MSRVKNNTQNDVSNFICEYGYCSYKTQKQQTAHPIPTVLDAALLKVTMASAIPGKQNAVVCTSMNSL